MLVGSWERFNRVWSALRLKLPCLPDVDILDPALKKRKADLGTAGSSKRPAKKKLKRPKHLSHVSSSNLTSEEGTSSGGVAVEPDDPASCLGASELDRAMDDDDGAEASASEESSRSGVRGR
ncbi:hypothetical protein GUJ93_ZPchr0012g20323 [Zizania palustris]|uniref:Uncharacterized protein n=1 Tax=Zizania palustris TaxID=103762 RepID=A0A8J5WPM6_ZIZPA|nr:hypothetical protein GUJ93_ZPchr0012g20323 [Zizania palustris]